MLLRILEPGLSPELPGDLDGVDAGGLPPGLLVAGAMDGAMMRAAERDGELVARFAAERPRLQVAKMMRIGLFASADETRLLGDISKVLPVAVAPRCREDERALVDAVGLIDVAVSLRARLMATQQHRPECLKQCHLRLPQLRTVRAPTACVQRRPSQAWHRLPRGYFWRGAPLRPNRREISRGDGPKLGGRRLLRLEGGRPLAMHAIATLSIAGLSRRHPPLSV